MPATVERTYYGEILGDEVGGFVRRFQPEDFIPCRGTILIVMPPPETETSGGIKLPDRSVQDQFFARVAAVPEGDAGTLEAEGCPFRPGDWVVFHRNAQKNVLFENRKDVAVLQYAADASSEILGFIPADRVERADFES